MQRNTRQEIPLWRSYFLYDVNNWLIKQKIMVNGLAEIIF